MGARRGARQRQQVVRLGASGFVAKPKAAKPKDKPKGGVAKPAGGLGTGRKRGSYCAAAAKRALAAAGFIPNPISNPITPQRTNKPPTPTQPQPHSPNPKECNPKSL